MRKPSSAAISIRSAVSKRMRAISLFSMSDNVLIRHAAVGEHGKAAVYRLIRVCGSDLLVEFDAQAGTRGQLGVAVHNLQLRPVEEILHPRRLAGRVFLDRR